MEPEGSTDLNLSGSSMELLEPEGYDLSLSGSSTRLLPLIYMGNIKIS